MLRTARSPILAAALVLALAATLLANSAAQARPLYTTITLQPDATAGVDAFIANGANAALNFGAYDTLYIGEENGCACLDRSVIKFDLSSIPAGSVINSATLSLKLKSDYSDNARTFRVYRVKRAWVEGTKSGSGTADGVTWNVYSTGNNWQTAGGGGANDIESSDIGSRAFSSSESLGVFVDWTLTAAAVQEMISGGTWTNNGFLIHPDTENGDAYGFYSSDDATAGNRPKLVIDYTAPTATPTVTNTPIPATATDTPVPPTATFTPGPTDTPTNTPIPATATDTPVPPTATFTPSPTYTPTPAWWIVITLPAPVLGTTVLIERRWTWGEEAIFFVMLALCLLVGLRWIYDLVRKEVEQRAD